MFLLNLLPSPRDPPQPASLTAGICCCCRNFNWRTCGHTHTHHLLCRRPRRPVNLYCVVLLWGQVGLFPSAIFVAINTYFLWLCWMFEELNKFFWFIFWGFFVVLCLLVVGVRGLPCSCCNWKEFSCFLWSSMNTILSRLMLIELMPRRQVVAKRWWILLQWCV